MMYKAMNGRPLVFQGEVHPHHPKLTVANDTKWYSYYLVRPNGVVNEVEWPSTLELACHDLPPYVDHVPNPVGMFERAYELHADLDHISFEAVIGRWMIESECGRRSWFEDLFGGVCDDETFREIRSKRWERYKGSKA